jgi:hypothetical protein
VTKAMVWTADETALLSSIRGCTPDSITKGRVSQICDAGNLQLPWPFYMPWVEVHSSAYNMRIGSSCFSRMSETLFKKEARLAKKVVW